MCTLPPGSRSPYQHHQYDRTRTWCQMNNRQNPSQEMTLIPPCRYHHSIRRVYHLVHWDRHWGVATVNGRSAPEGSRCSSGWWGTEGDSSEKWRSRAGWDWGTDSNRCRLKYQIKKNNPFRKFRNKSLIHIFFFFVTLSSWLDLYCSLWWFPWWREMRERVCGYTMYSFLREWWWPWKGPTHARCFDKFVHIVSRFIFIRKPNDFPF